jgi:TonB family protein
MSRLDVISSPRLDQGRKHHRRAFVASLLFHTLALGSALALTFVYRSHLPLILSGSLSGAPSITLEKIVVSPPAPQPVSKPVAPPAASNAPAPVPPATAQTQTPPPHDPMDAPKPPGQGVPVLAVQPAKPAQTLPPPAAKPAPTTHTAISHASAATAQNHFQAAAASSSYAPGPNALPHPPYPEEAREHRRIGTVIMNVLFDDQGNVARAEVTETSGVPLLDSATLSYIRRHWHSAAYAGRTVSVPVQYKLENL